MKRVLFVALLCASANAAAQTFCVGTDSELQSRLFQAQAIASLSPGTPVELRLRRRPEPYQLTQVPETNIGYPFDSLAIRGGYSPDLQDDCSDQERQVNAGNTTISYEVPGIWIINTTGDFLLEGVTFDSPQTLNVAHEGFGLTRVDILSNIFAGPGFIALYVGKNNSESSDATYRVVNNLFTDVTTQNRCAIRLRNTFPGSVNAEIANNTVTGNSGGGVCVMGLELARFDNNIIWGNATGIVDESADDPPDTHTPIQLIHNLLQVPNPIPGLIGGHIGAMNTDPQFAAGTFHLSPASPAINSGAPGSVPGGLPAFDLDGNTRITGSRVDRGAYESFTQDTDMIVVNTAEDTLETANGKMSLRSAIALANSDPGVETIKFDIGSPAVCEARIVLDEQLGNLPEITESLEIDGYSQGPASQNTLAEGFDANICVALIGDGSGDGLVAGLSSQANATIKGLRIAGMKTAIRLWNGTHVIEGNSFEPITDSGNLRNVTVDGGTAFIGGNQPAQRNLLSGASSSAVALYSDGNFVAGNHIGPKIDGILDPESRNGHGILVYGSNNTVDGNQAIGNVGVGIFVEGSLNSISSNIVSSNDRGVEFRELAGEVTEQNLVYGNEIAYNKQAGIVVPDNSFRNEIWANSIHDNGGQGIDLSDDGQVNANDTDVGFASTEGNRGLNFPVLAEVKTLEGSLPNTAQVLGVLISANGTFEIRFYANDECDESGHGEGQEPIGTTTIQITNAGQFTNGSKGFSVPVASLTNLGGRYVTATASDSLGNTSEFGACQLVDTGQLFRDGFEGP